MVHTFKGVRDEVMRLLDESSVESATTLQLIKDAINIAHQQRCTEHPWQFMLWPGVITFSTVTGTHEYPLHQEFHRPLYFLNRTTREFLQEVPMRSVPMVGVDWVNDNDYSQHFCYWGMQPVQYQPAVPTTVSIVSDNAGDTGTSYGVVVKGEDAYGAVRAEIIYPSGLTPVSGNVTFRKILGVTKAGGWAGYLSLTDNTDNTVLLRLLACEMGRQYKTIFILENPTPGAETVEYRFYRQPLFLVNDYDVVELPAPHGQLLVYDALIHISGYLTETNPQTLQIWKLKQGELEQSLYQAYATEGQTLEAVPQFVRYMGDGTLTSRWPRWGS
jgi:hypothetical protein